MNATCHFFTQHVDSWSSPPTLPQTDTEVYHLVRGLQKGVRCGIMRLITSFEVRIRRSKTNQKVRIIGMHRRSLIISLITSQSLDDEKSESLSSLRRSEDSLISGLKITVVSEDSTQVLFAAS